MRSEANESKTGLAWALAVGFALLAVGFRVVPYYLDLGPYARWVWNLTPVGALGLFAGARLRSQAAYLVPLLVMLASDLLLIKPLADHGFSAFSWGRPIIYASFLLNVLIGRALRERSSPFGLEAVVSSRPASSFSCRISSSGPAAMARCTPRT